MKIIIEVINTFSKTSISIDDKNIWPSFGFLSISLSKNNLIFVSAVGNSGIRSSNSTFFSSSFSIARFCNKLFVL